MRLALAAALLLAGCSAYRNVTTAPVAGPDGTAVVAIAQGGNDQLGFVDADDRLVIITAELDRQGTIDALLPSPDGTTLLICSRGEGHPYLSLYDLGTLVRQHDAVAVPALRTLDPYPGGCDDPVWLDDHTLRFTSTIDFSRFDAQARRGADTTADADAPVRTWAWDWRNDTFRALPATR